MQEYDVQRVMRGYPDSISMEIHCADAGHWNKLPDKSYAKHCKIRINSVDILDSSSEKLNAFISEYAIFRRISIVRLSILFNVIELIGIISFLCNCVCVWYRFCVTIISASRFKWINGQFGCGW